MEGFCKFCKVKPAMYYSHAPEDCHKLRTEVNCDHEATCQDCADYAHYLIDELELSRN